VKVLALEEELDAVDQSSFTEELLRAEALHLYELTQSGVVREVHFRVDRRAAVLVLEVADIEEAQRVVSELPLVRAGLIRFDVIGLAPYPGFGRLFAEAPPRAPSP
jgi:hypothetical protein